MEPKDDMRFVSVMKDTPLHPLTFGEPGSLGLGKNEKDRLFLSPSQPASTVIFGLIFSDGFLEKQICAVGSFIYAQEDCWARANHHLYNTDGTVGGTAAKAIVAALDLLSVQQFAAVRLQSSWSRSFTKLVTCNQGFTSMLWLQSIILQKEAKLSR